MQIRHRRPFTVDGFVQAVLVLALMALPGIPAAQAKEKLPETSPEGLVLQKDTKLEVVYLRPGVNFGGYDKFAILECAVAFRRDWQQDQNSSTPFRVSKEDMDRIKTTLGDEFKKVFVAELQGKGGYQIVDAGAPDVLILRPAIINLDVQAPNPNMQPGMSATFSASAGQMTLYLEIFDSVTSQILARVIDAEAGQDAGRIQMQSGVTNKVEADRILKKWAGILRGALDTARAKAASSTKQ
jgi:hypothetical protein